MTPYNIIIDVGSLASIGLGHWFGLAFAIAAGAGLGGALGTVLTEILRDLRKRGR